MYVCRPYVRIRPAKIERQGVDFLRDNITIYIKYINALKTQLELPGNRTQVFLTIPRDSGVVFCMCTDKLTNS